MHTEFLNTNLKEGDHLEDVGVDRKVTVIHCVGK
jgi:hypothetical protein